MKIVNWMANARKMVVVTVLGLFFCGQVGAMELVTPVKTDNALICVQTSDGVIVSLERWKIDEMKALLVLLEHQKNQNSQNNPLDASGAITLQELQLLSDALEQANQSEDAFRKLFFSMAEKEGLLEVASEGTGFRVTCGLGNGALRILINAAQKVEAVKLTALFLSCLLDVSEQKKLLVPYFIGPVVSFLKYKIMHGRDIKKHFDAGMGVFCVTFSPDGKRLLSIGLQGANNIALWDVASGECIKKITAHERGHIIAGAFSPDGSVFATCGEGDRNLILWDAKIGEKIDRFFTGIHAPACSVAFSPDGTKMVVGYQSNTNNVVIWDSFTGAKLQVLEGFSGYGPHVTSVAFSPNGKQVAVGYNLTMKDNIILFDLGDGANVTKEFFAGHRARVHSVAFSNNGKWLVSGAAGQENNLRVWDVRTKKMVADLEGHPNIVFSAKFSPDDTQIASGCLGNENNAVVWDWSSFGTLEVLSLSFNNDLPLVYSVGFSPDGNSIVVGGGGTDIIMNQLFTEKDRNFLRQLSGLNLVQAVVVYKLCLMWKSGKSLELTAADQKVLDSLPESLRTFLLQFFEQNYPDEGSYSDEQSGSGEDNSSFEEDFSTDNEG